MVDDVAGRCESLPVLVVAMVSALTTDIGVGRGAGDIVRPRADDAVSGVVASEGRKRESFPGGVVVGSWAVRFSQLQLVVGGEVPDDDAAAVPCRVAV